MKLMLGMFFLICILLSSSWLYAADHTDPPSRALTPTNAADIADFYAWHKGSGDEQMLVMVLTFAGPSPAGQDAVYDANVLYTVSIDNTGDAQANTQIYVRFGLNPAGEWGVQVINLPGALGPVVGAVESVLESGVAKVYTGLRDDPFFFDLQGFQETLMTGTLSFSPMRDSFAGSNTTAIVLEVPLSNALGVGNTLSLWATTARIAE